MIEYYLLLLVQGGEPFSPLAELPVPTTTTIYNPYLEVTAAAAKRRKCPSSARSSLPGASSRAEADPGCRDPFWTGGRTYSKWGGGTFPCSIQWNTNICITLDPANLMLKSV